MDVLARFGGKELVVLLPHAGLKSAVATAECLRLAVARGSAELRDVPPLTISLGVSQFHVRDGTIDGIIARADRVLYGAKQAGRNTVRMPHEG